MEARDDIGKFIQMCRAPCASTRKDFGADIKQCFNIGEDIYQRFGERIGAQVSQFGRNLFHTGEALRSIAVSLT